MSAGLTMKPIEPLNDFANILRDQQTFGDRDNDEGGLSNTLNNEFDKLMIQSGLDIGPGVMLFFCLFASILAGGIMFVFQENPLTAAMLGGVGAAAPILVAIVARQRRQQKMMQQLPGMIDELARAAKTGRSIQQCWEIVANDTQVPLGDELKTCSNRMRMGEDLAAALQELPYRTGIVTLNILVTALSVHQQTGGDLVRVLERLSQTIRDRLLFLGRLRAATAGSRLTAVLMLGLPVFIIMFFSARDAEYFPKLMASRMGQNVTLIGVGLQIVGTIIISNILRNSQRS